MAYPRYQKRTVQNLNGTWDFAFLGEDVSLEDDLIDIAIFNEKMVVPSAIDASPAYAGCRGTFAYKTEITVTPETSGRIRFNGLGMWCRVYVDGQELHECTLPYSGFWVDVPASTNEKREIIVIIDNRFDKIRVPLQSQYFDFYAYGGIFRSVEWHEYKEFCIQRATISQVDEMICAEIILHGNTPNTIDIQVLLNDEAAENFTKIDIKDNKATVSIPKKEMELWTPASPILHTMHITIGEDDIIERFGLRELSVEDGNIHLNGEPIKLLGYCRHEAHPQFGPALPHQQLLNDLQTLKDLGCNFVRGAHYPQDQRFLDLCDELGFLVLEESLSWQASIKNFQNPKFCALQEEQTRLMVRNSINHPSVIIWAFLNEGDSNSEHSKALYKRLADCVREEDSTRLVSFASNHPFDELNFDLCDVVCVNIYPGWYNHKNIDPLGDIVPVINSVMDSLEEQGVGDKPFILSEIGAGAIYGWRDSHNAPWSEGFQEQHLEIVCREVVENKKIAGVSLWQFCDCRTYSNAGALGRPRAFNNKGTLDEFRRPKSVYATVKKIFRQET